MKVLRFKKSIFLLLTSILLAGCTNNPEPIVGPQGEQGAPGEVGPQGDPGKDGVSIVSITKTATEGNVDTYTITYSDGASSTFTVTNGSDGKQGIQGEKGDDGHTPTIKIGENGNWLIDGEDTGISAQGPSGENGFDGTSVLTGHGLPLNDLGNIGDSYIDLDTWNYYVKSNEGWQLGGNIKGADGNDGVNGVSVESANIDENGDLIITLSNGEVINAGNINNTNKYTVKFYCDELLVDTQLVEHGKKITLPELEDFTVKHWYIDKEFEYEWLWYGCVVTEDMSLYGKYTPIAKNISFNNTANISIDDYGFGTSLNNEKEICVSKADASEDYLTILESRGILFNRSEIGYINSVSINIENEGFSSAKIYYGSTPLSFDYSQDLSVGTNDLVLSDSEYFTIQNTGTEPINISYLNIDYSVKTKIFDHDIPTIVINTKDAQAVTSRTTYVDCDVSTLGAEKDVSGLKGQIKVRGNSTSTLPKKPYRIKLSKKSSLFGCEKAKNWVLLADYMDGSNMHNYTALKFAKMVRGDETFGPDPLHVNVVLNGENVGLYTFCEHIDVKEGRLNIEQDNIWEKNFDEINFYIERDSSTLTDPLEIEGTTYFKVPLENYPLSQYVFAIKYPEKEDFEEELNDGSIDKHEAEFQTFFNSLKNYMTNICNMFVDYYHDKSEFENVAQSVDMESLALYAVIDQTFGEEDHNQKSFKMYRKNGGLLKFGPNWDYDSCAYSLPYQGTYILNPFDVGGSYNRVYFTEKWGYMLFNDTANGKPLFGNIWSNLTNEQIESFLYDQQIELKTISNDTMCDCERWMHNQYFSAFDNQLYFWNYITHQLPYLKNYYSNL